MVISAIWSIFAGPDVDHIHPEPSVTLHSLTCPHLRPAERNQVTVRRSHQMAPAVRKKYSTIADTVHRQSCSDPCFIVRSVRKFSVLRLKYKVDRLREMCGNREI